MKKIGAIFVALIFLLSVVSFAFAQENASANETISNNSAENALNETEKDGSDMINETSEADSIVNETLEDGTEIITTSKPYEPPVVEPVIANETTDTDEIPSITPDNIVLWGLKRAFERVDMLFTFGKSAKAEKGLAQARERLLEVQAMIEAKKLPSAEKAALAYKESVSEAKENVAEMDENSISDVEKIQQEISNHELEIIQVQNKIKQTTETMTSEQQSEINSIFLSIEDHKNELRVSADDKKSRTEMNNNAKDNNVEDSENQSGEQAQDSGENETQSQGSKRNSKNNSKGK